MNHSFPAFLRPPAPRVPEVPLDAPRRGHWVTGTLLPRPPSLGLCAICPGGPATLGHANTHIRRLTIEATYDS